MKTFKKISISLLFVLMLSMSLFTSGCFFSVTFTSPPFDAEIGAIYTANNHYLKFTSYSTVLYEYNEFGDFYNTYDFADNTPTTPSWSITTAPA